MEPPEKELTGGGDKCSDINLPFRALNKDFNKAAIPDTSTALGRRAWNSGRRNLRGRGTHLTFPTATLYRIARAREEMTCLHQNILKEKEMLEEGLEGEKKVEKERAGRKGKAPVIPVNDVDPSPTEEVDEEITQLKKQIRGLQGKMMEGVNDKTKGYNQIKRIVREEIPD